MRTPDHVWDQLLDREDQQIGVQEMLAVLLTWGTFQCHLSESLWTCFVDNDGVLGAILKGSSRAPEVNIAVGHLWLALAQQSVGLHVARVESGANVSDGPTREEFGDLQRLGAVWVEPVLPPWVCDLWGIPEPSCPSTA